MTTARLNIFEGKQRDVLDVLATHLPISDMANCTLLSKSTYGIFNNNLRSHGFMNFVKKADYKNVEKSIRVLGADIIFTNMNVKISEKAYNLSPLAYAIKVCDIDMLRCFLAAIHACGNKRLLDRLLRELNQPVEQINLEPLFEVYLNYLNRCSLWFNGKIDDDQIKKDLLLLGIAKAKYLPAHMFKTNGHVETPTKILVASVQRDLEMFKKLFTTRVKDTANFIQQPLGITKQDEPVAASRNLKSRMFR